MDGEGIIEVGRRFGADAVHPGYGFLSENCEFARMVEAAGMVFIGPRPEQLEAFGDKQQARRIARAAGVPVLPATEDPERAHEVGFPLMVKAAKGGGGRGMRVVNEAGGLEGALVSASREAKAAFGDGSLYLEKLVRRAQHVEVQILGDKHGNVSHLFERDCSIQRRNQKMIECAPAAWLKQEDREKLCGWAVALMQGYENAGTVEFLHDMDSGEFWFIEVNPRIQVEHTVTEEVTGVDIVKAQIRIAEGEEVRADAEMRGCAIQCRIVAEDPQEGFKPDYGRITAYRGAAGFGVRLDGGTAYSGAVVTRHYDSLLEKVTAWAPSREEACARMVRALREFRIRGVATNLAFLESVVKHPQFVEGNCDTGFVEGRGWQVARKRDRATRLLRYLAHMTVNER